MIEIYDTTLRDGAQRTDISFSLQDKINIALRLDEFGVDYIEGGWPGSNPKDVEFFAMARAHHWKNAQITSFGSTCGVDKQPENDANIQAMVNSATPVCAVVGKTSLLHVNQVLRTTPENNLRIIRDSVAYLQQMNRKVLYDAEQFFDGYKEDPAYALLTLRAAAEAGSRMLVLCDTNGGTLPHEVFQIVTDVVRQIPGVQFGIHAHNDSEVAVANTLAGVDAGCVHVQGTINGYGERCGNANLCSVIPALAIKNGKPSQPAANLTALSDLSRYVAEVANLAHDDHQPYVGKAAFAHKGGIHVAAMRRTTESYQHIDPALVGNESAIIVSELSGRGNLLSKMEEYGVQLPAGFDVRPVLEEIKLLESKGYSFEAAEASVMMLLSRNMPDYRPPYDLIDFSVQVEHRQGRGILAEATVKLNIQGEVMHTAAEGNGPVNALDTALRKALIQHHPEINSFHLSDYKVRILDTGQGTGSTTRVLIETTGQDGIWSTVGASANIIEASWHALNDSMEYGIAQSARRSSVQ